MKCNIIIPTWNDAILTGLCIESIKKNTKFPYRIFLIDNGSSDEIACSLKLLSENNKDIITLIRNEENLGFPKAVNKGISLSDSPYLCILNNDTEVCKDWLTEMIKVAEREKDIGIINPASNNLGITAPYKAVPAAYIEMANCIGFCMLIKREVIDKIGGFDEIYSPGNFEDTDFCRKADMAGYRCVMAENAYVYHKENTSFKKRKDYHHTFARNRDIFHSRWGRPERVAYFLNNLNSDVLRDIDSFLKKGDWVYVFLNNNNAYPDMKRHTSLKVSNMASLFAVRSLWHVLKRKKRFTSIFTDDKGSYSVLRWLKCVRKI